MNLFLKKALLGIGTGLASLGTVGMIGRVLVAPEINTNAETPSSYVQQTPTIAPVKEQKPAEEPKKPVVETKTETETVAVPYETQYTNDNTLAKGSTKIVQNGQNGTKIETYTVTYADGKVTKRELTSSRVTVQPTPKIIANGTYVAPAPAPQNCPNGTYVNTAGNRVCRPAASASVPSGATAKCKDGTYSYSQSRRGTCSHHGGVATWY